MPTDFQAQTNQINKEEFPTVIGFQAAETVDASSNYEECEKVAAGKQDSEQSQSFDSSSPISQQEPLVGYDLVKDMMRRQDAVLMQLDDLNAQIESTIKEISAVRKSEIEALDAEPEFNQSDSANPTGHRKAA